MSKKKAVKKKATKKKATKKKAAKKAAPKKAARMPRKPDTSVALLTVLEKILGNMEVLVELALRNNSSEERSPVEPQETDSPEESPKENPKEEKPKTAKAKAKAKTGGKKKKKTKKEDVRKALMEVRDKTKDDKYKDIMAEFTKEGSSKERCRKVSEIQEGDYDLVLQSCEEVLKSLPEPTPPEPETSTDEDDIFND
ncbi:hypothetical protein KAR91_76750 [Candidatus Pacearchaeota archaeon]|nr:hypothetical protein [Candidatus Pacearchaeota archaeon]